jgi:hypothetical protein
MVSDAPAGISESIAAVRQEHCKRIMPENVVCGTNRQAHVLSEREMQISVRD